MKCGTDGHAVKLISLPIPGPPIIEPDVHAFIRTGLKKPSRLPKNDNAFLPSTMSRAATAADLLIPDHSKAADTGP